MFILFHSLIIWLDFIFLIIYSASGRIFTISEGLIPLTDLELLENSTHITRMTSNLQNICNPVKKKRFRACVLMSPLADVRSSSLKDVHWPRLQTRDQKRDSDYSKFFFLQCKSRFRLIEDGDHESKVRSSQKYSNMLTIFWKPSQREWWSWLNW